MKRFAALLAAALLLLVQSAYLIARPAQLWGLCGFCMAAAAAGTDLLLRRRDRLPLLLAVGVCLAAGRVSLSGVSTLRLWRCCPCPAPPCPGSVPPLSRCASGHSAP